MQARTGQHSISLGGAGPGIHRRRKMVEAAGIEPAS